MLLALKHLKWYYSSQKSSGIQLIFHITHTLFGWSYSRLGRWAWFQGWQVKSIVYFYLKNSELVICLKKCVKHFHFEVIFNCISTSPLFQKLFICLACAFSRRLNQFYRNVFSSDLVWDPLTKHNCFFSRSLSTKE